MRSKVFRIYVEDVTEQAEAIEKLVQNRLACFTVYHAVGCWDGKQEGSLVIENICESDFHVIDRANIRQLALELKQLLKQECVLVTEQEIESELI